MPKRKPDHFKTQRQNSRRRTANKIRNYVADCNASTKELIKELGVSRQWIQRRTSDDPVDTSIQDVYRLVDACHRHGFTTVTGSPSWLNDIEPTIHVAYICGLSRDQSAAANEATH